MGAPLSRSVGKNGYLQPFHRAPYVLCLLRMDQKADGANEEEKDNETPQPYRQYKSFCPRASASLWAEYRLRQPGGPRLFAILIAFVIRRTGLCCSTSHTRWYPSQLAPL